MEKKSKIAGVYWRPKIKRWTVEMRVKGFDPQKMYCGCYKEKRKAEAKAIEVRKEFPKQRRGQQIFRGISRKFRGVYRNYNRYRAIIGIRGKYIYLGNYKTAILAAIAYDGAAKVAYGEDAITNQNQYPDDFLKIA